MVYLRQVRHLENNYRAKLMTSNFFLEVRDYSLKMLYVNDIFCPVSHREEQDGYAALYEDVMKNGMKNPAIVVENTEENYHLSIRQVNTEYIKDWDSSYKWLCMYGNQRLDIMKKAKSSFIPSLLAENVEWSHALYLELKNSS